MRHATCVGQRRSALLRGAGLRPRSSAITAAGARRSSGRTPPRGSALGRAIVYDRRGSNRSERPEPYDVTSVREHADDALALMRALDAEPAVLIGRATADGRARPRAPAPGLGARGRPARGGHEGLVTRVRRVVRGTRRRSSGPRRAWSRRGGRGRAPGRLRRLGGAARRLARRLHGKRPRLLAEVRGGDRPTTPGFTSWRCLRSS